MLRTVSSSMPGSWCPPQVSSVQTMSQPHCCRYNPIKTIKTNFLGTMNMLGLAKRTRARFLISSTSEVYGDPIEHPQTETYWGNVNCIGERSCYDEGTYWGRGFVWAGAQQCTVTTYSTDWADVWESRQSGAEAGTGVCRDPSSPTRLVKHDVAHMHVVEGSHAKPWP